MTVAATAMIGYAIAQGQAPPPPPSLHPAGPDNVGGGAGPGGPGGPGRPGEHEQMLEIRGMAEFAGAMEHLSRMCFNSEAVGVMAVGALLKDVRRKDEAVIKDLEDQLESVKTQGLRNAIHLSLKDIYKRQGEDEKVIRTARKYGLRPGTVKCDIFRLFDEGYSPQEVRYLLRNYAVEPATFSRTVSTGIRLKNWKMMPTCFLLKIVRSRSVMSVSRVSPMLMEPSSGVSMPPARFNRELFPTPLFPTMTEVFCEGKRTSRCSKIKCRLPLSLYDFVTFEK